MTPHAYSMGAPKTSSSNSNTNNCYYYYKNKALKGHRNTSK